jgi:hypothetical protein
MCRHCAAMFFDGFPQKGTCPSGGGHEPGRNTYTLAHDMEVPRNHQSDWRFCGRCNSMFFGAPPIGGVCAAGGSHEAQGFVFVLPTTDAHSVIID